MRTIAAPAAGLLLIALTACPAPREPRVMGGAGDGGQQTGPPPTIGVDANGGPDERSNPPGLIWESAREVSSAYRIFDQEGRIVAETPNPSPLVVTNEGPSELSLPPGRYLVRLDLPDGSARTFWVTIERQRRAEGDPSRLGPTPPAR